ncbi:MAG: DUF2125 domain-containing protein [Sneathiella sp.]|nr:DUF2125 domain-containing protein [Sneathiella sp.]
MRILFTGITALVVLAGGYVLSWHHVADTLLAVADNWLQQRIAEGYSIEHGPLVVSDFPYRVKVTTENLSISNPAHHQKPKIEVAHFWAVVQPWQINHVIFGVEGAGRADWLDHEEPMSLDFAATSARGSATFNLQGRMQTLAIDIKGLQAVPSWRPPVSADRLQLHGRPAPLQEEGAQAAEQNADGQQIALKVSNMTIEGLEDFPLGQKIDELALSSVLHGTIEKLPSAETLDLWRNSGGFLEIQALDANWGHGALKGDGALTLDDHMRPLGKLDTRISGYGKILEALVSTGKVDTDAARTIGFGLNLLAKDGEDGGRYIALPLTAHAGGVYLGPIFLMRLNSLFKE